MLQVLKISYSMTAFCLHLFFLLMCSLLLMTDSLSAVPHQHLASATSNGFHPISFHCSGDFALHNKYCYRYFGAESKRAFYHAEKQCAHFRSTLVSLLSFNEEEFVVQLAANNTAFWIGLNDDEGPETGHTEGVFKWTSGEEYSEMKYQKWKTGEPNNRKHLDCVKADASGWAMATGGCAASKLPYVCKKKACPQGLEWDGKSCDIVIDSGNINKEKSVSDWSISTRYWTLIFMFLASLIVLLISFVAKTSKIASSKRSLTLNSCKEQSGKHHQNLKNTSFSRVEDLLPPS